MAAPTQAHVKIGSFEYLLAIDQPQHYLHEKPEVLRPYVYVGDSQTERNMFHDRLLWPVTDWSGGEGARSWVETDPTTYNYSDDDPGTGGGTEVGGALNPRIDGQVTGNPARSTQTVTVTSQTKKPFLTIANGRLWLAGSRELFYTGDPSGAWTAAAAAQATMDITGAGGDEGAIYFAGSDGTNKDLRKQTVSGAGGASTVVITSYAMTTTDGAFRNEMCFYNGRMYAWSGRSLYEIDTFATTAFPLVINQNPGYRVIYTQNLPELSATNFEAATDDGWTCGMAAGDNSLIFFTSQRGQTQLYEFKAGVGRPIGVLPLGFTGKDVCVNNSIVFITGHWGPDTSTATGAAAGFAMPLDSKKFIPLGNIRKHVNNTNLQMHSCSSSYGVQVLMVAGATGQVFVYDADHNAFSLLDHVSLTANDKILASVTYGPYRVAIKNTPGSAGTTYRSYAWASDEPSDRATTSATHDISIPLYMPYYDFSIGNDAKSIQNIQVAYEVEDNSTTSGLKAGQQIVIGYALDDGVYTDLTAITSATTPSTGVKGRHLIQISTTAATKKAFRAAYRITLKGIRTGGVNYQPPILHATTMEARSLARDETWTLILRVQDELEQTRLSNRRWRASDARDNLLALSDNKNLVTFLDYFRYSPNDKPLKSTTHTVIVSDVSDEVMRNAEGVMKVVLKAVTA